MRVLPTLFVLLAILAACPARSTPPEVVRGPDHVMVWTTDEAASDALLTRLGFTLRPAGSFEDFASSRTVMFADQTFLELFHIYDRSKATSPQARAELAFFDQGSGANSFAIQVTSAAKAQARLRAAGFDVDEVQADSFDPDGPDGPKPAQPANWRDFHFRRSPVQGAEVFFIQYAPEPPPSPQAQDRFDARTTHANGAQRLSAVWLLVEDPKVEAEAYRRMGFPVRPPAWVPSLGVEATTVAVGTGQVILLGPGEPPGLPSPSTRRGPRIVGLSIAVSDLSAARQRVRSQYPDAALHEGPLAIAPSIRDLGVFLAFHGPE